MASETRCPGCEDSKLPFVTHNYDESRWQVEHCCGWKGPTCDTRELAIAAWNTCKPPSKQERVMIQVVPYAHTKREIRYNVLLDGGLVEWFNLEKHAERCAARLRQGLEETK